MAAVGFLLLLSADLLWGALRSIHRAMSFLYAPHVLAPLPSFSISAQEWDAAAAKLREPARAPSSPPPPAPDETLATLADQMERWVRDTAGTGVVPWAVAEHRWGLRGASGNLALLKLLREGRIAAIPDGLHPCEPREAPSAPQEAPCAR